MASKIDELLAQLPSDRRAALEELRRQIRATAPDATELINYGVPAFKLDRRPFVSYGSAKHPLRVLRPAPGSHRRLRGRPRRLPGRLVEARIAEIRATAG